jgi:hypothetical protein
MSRDKQTEIEEMCEVLRKNAEEVIDQIAKEMLEGDNEN